MRNELDVFFAALLYYSRIPVPTLHGLSEITLAKAFRYLPLVGTIVGGIAGGVFWLASSMLPFSVAVLAALATAMLLTGALHEDGLADVFDGFGGGSSPEAILGIMKDSHIGTYGVLGVLLLLGFKVSTLLAMPEAQIPAVLMAAHGISRAPILFLVKTSTYARQEQSKAQHTRLGVSNLSLLIGTVLGIIPLFAFSFIFASLYLLLSGLLTAAYRLFLHRKIGGFTGDTLGALQQAMEVLFYLTYLALTVS